jgi:hypothetical protein
MDILFEYAACVALDGAHAAHDNAPASMRFSLFDVGCGVQSRRIDCSVESAIHVRTHGMTTNKLVGTPGSPAENNGNSADCAIACPPHGLGLAGRFCWFCRNDSDVEL